MDEKSDYSELPDQETLSKMEPTDFNQLRDNINSQLESQASNTDDDS